ncbi:MAG TPA: hypothetical protein VD886_12265 [Herpetosiphonaceae bacterium]|nr:hypothetical protein [Herpetosiphonaceae bacterium]
MTSTSHSQGQPVAYSRPAADEYPAPSRTFDLLVTLGGLWFIFGLYLDGWAHNQPNLVDSFFTPWHAVLYSGFLIVGACIGGMQVRNMLRGHSLTRALPRGYWPSLLGVAMFASGGGFDLVWHEIFGFEANIDALLSPAHLWLATGALLALTGPLRAAWDRARTTPQRGWRDLTPAVLSLFLVFAVLTFFTVYMGPLGSPGIFVADAGVRRYFIALQAVSMVLVYSALLVGVLLLGLRAFQLPRGTVTLLLGAGTLMMFFTQIRAARDFPALLLVAAGAGVLGDLALARWRPSAARVRALRAFSFGLPCGFFAAYYAVLELTHGLVITEHMWLGTSVMAGIAGLFISYIFAPPLGQFPGQG